MLILEVTDHDYVSINAREYTGNSYYVPMLSLLRCEHHRQNTTIQFLRPNTDANHKLHLIMSEQF
jgi:hypothetical protein